MSQCCLLIPIPPLEYLLLIKDLSLSLCCSSLTSGMQTPSADGWHVRKGASHLDMSKTDESRLYSKRLSKQVA